MEQLILKLEEIHCMANEVSNSVEHLDYSKIGLLVQEMQKILPFMFQINEICEIDNSFILEVLSDLLNGMENKDQVLIKDTLQYGLSEIIVFYQSIYNEIGDHANE